jgi:hypothetical protein
MRTSVYSAHPGIAAKAADGRGETGDPDAYLETAERCVEAIYTRTPARLINTGGLKKGHRITHRIEVTSLADIDEDLMRWLERAHDMDR